MASKGGLRIRPVKPGEAEKEPQRKRVGAFLFPGEIEDIAAIPVRFDLRCYLKAGGEMYYF